METVAAPTQPESTKPVRATVAGAVHTVILLLILFGWAYLGARGAERMRGIEHPNRVVFYTTTIVWEWIVVGFIAFGVKRHGGSMSELVGGRWKSAKDVFRDIGIAFGFWIIALVILGVTAQIVHAAKMEQRVSFLTPQGIAEVLLWIALSVTAGLCEETIFRGYLQKQFSAWTRNTSAGVLLSAAAFGGAHMYQGYKSAIVIAVYGLLFGILAELRGSLRPGMMTHAWHDTIGGIALKFLHK